MKAFLINASPRGRGSNTLLLAQAFLRGLGCEYDTATLSELRITPCTGCMTCWQRGDGQCVFSESMQELLAKVKEMVAELRYLGVSQEELQILMAEREENDT